MVPHRQSLNLYNTRRMNKITIDAKGKSLGRIAAEAASILNGKTSVEFAKNKVVDVAVEIVNAGGLVITEKKDLQTKFARYSGYPGGLRIETLKQLRTRGGNTKVLSQAIKGMLPINKLRNERMKNLTITE